METARSKSKSKAVSNAERFRVRDLALSLASEEGFARDPTSEADDTLEIVELAALLHDIGDYKYTKDSVEDASIVEHFLEEEGLEESKRERILSIIKGMGFKNEISQTAPITSLVEFGVVQDADRLDAIGAIDAAPELLRESLSKPHFTLLV